jgi:hypothetical protein
MLLDHHLQDEFCVALAPSKKYMDYRTRVLEFLYHRHDKPELSKAA